MSGWFNPETTLAPTAWPFLTLVGLVAGFLNVLAGGGSLMTLPTLIFFGLPAGVANGTNRVAIVIQNFGAVRSMKRRGRLDRAWVVLAVPPAVLGAVVGMMIAVRTPDADLQRVLAVAMLCLAAWIVLNPVCPPPEGEAAPVPVGLRRRLFAVGFFVVGLYGGFIQAGVGFVILALATGGGLDFVRSTALKLTLVLAFTPLALVGFASQGLVDWGAGLALAVGNLAGALLGVRLAVRKGGEWLRVVVVALVVVFAVALWVRA
ncbi:MAG: sulfite exporter TauE/SafE family protein [Longimicrobiales bacterium]|nr:sulfite exporter TauE/SafE family protein [Longimicrobiales bacterium]